MLAYRLDFALLNKLLKIVIQCLELKIFIGKVAVLFGSIKKKKRIKPRLSQ